MYESPRTTSDDFCFVELLKPNALPHSHVTDCTAAIWANKLRTVSSDVTFHSFTELVGFALFTGYEGPWGEKRYSSSLFLDLGTRRG
jgi:hypothetical protein